MKKTTTHLFVRIAAAALTIATFTGCASLPNSTPYLEARGQGDGYSVAPFENGYSVAAFKGNRETKQVDAVRLSLLTALDHCKAQNKSSIWHKPVDASQKQTYTSVSSYSTPIYGRDGSVVSYVPQTYSTPVTLVFPHYLTLFRCTKKVGATEIEDFEKLSREIVHTYMRDFKGALLIKKVKPDSKSFKVDDVLVEFGKKRIGDISDYYGALEEYAGQTVSAYVLRNKRRTKIDVAVSDNTNELNKLNAQLMAETCQGLSAFYQQTDEVAYDGTRLDLRPRPCQTAAPAPKSN